MENFSKKKQSKEKLCFFFKKIKNLFVEF